MFKICLVALSIAKNDNNAIAVGEAFNTLMNIIHGIEGDSNKVKIAPRKSKQPNLEVLKYIKGENTLRQKVVNMYMTSDMDNPEKKDNMSGFKSPYIMA